jgi:hypothetical protein
MLLRPCRSQWKSFTWGRFWPRCEFDLTSCPSGSHCNGNRQYSTVTSHTRHSQPRKALRDGRHQEPSNRLPSDTHGIACKANHTYLWIHGLIFSRNVTIITSGHLSIGRKHETSTDQYPTTSSLTNHPQDTQRGAMGSYPTRHHPPLALHRHPSSHLGHDLHPGPTSYLRRRSDRMAPLDPVRTLRPRGPRLQPRFLLQRLGMDGCAGFGQRL